MTTLSMENALTIRLCRVDLAVHAMYRKNLFSQVRRCTAIMKMLISRYIEKLISRYTAVHLRYTSDLRMYRAVHGLYRNLHPTAVLRYAAL